VNEKTGIQIMSMAGTIWNGFWALNERELSNIRITNHPKLNPYPESNIINNIKRINRISLIKEYFPKSPQM